MPTPTKANRTDDRAARSRGSDTPALTEPPESWPPFPMNDSGEAYARALWALGTCVESDAFALGMAAVMLARREVFLSTLDAEGWTSVTKNGATMHPAARLLKATETELLRLLGKLGLDCESRVRLAVAPPTKPLDLDAIRAIFGASSE